jgi:hypothetical protein
VDKIACKILRRRRDRMGKTTKSRDAALKAKIAFEAARGEKTISQLAGEYGVHPLQGRIYASCTSKFLKSTIWIPAGVYPVLDAGRE